MPSLKSCPSVLREIDEQPENRNGNQRQSHVHQDLAALRCPALFPVPQLDPVRGLDLIEMRKVPRELVSGSVTMMGLALDGPVNHLL